MPAGDKQVLTVKATPHKRFFIDMITRDISLEACVMDLVDNCVDGATRQLSSKMKGKGRVSPKPHALSSGSNRYTGYKVNVTLSKSSFKISDNCGGIGVGIACDYAFNFGRDPQKLQDGDTTTGIGIYGIGMKRALFKLGAHFAIRSYTEHDGFTMSVDVTKWAANPGDWDMELTTAGTSQKKIGTTIEVTRLRAPVARELGTTAFTSRLINAVGRTYAAFLDQGLEIRINRLKVQPTEFSFLRGKGFQALHERFTRTPPKPSKKTVKIELWAGAAAARARPGYDEGDDASMWGWYVLCNNRVVLSADKTDRTGWGVGKFPQWHPQYNGFIGIVSFRSDEPYALPWTTTKNDIDIDSVVYKSVRTEMQNAARGYVSYSRVRKSNPDDAKAIEREAKPVLATKISTAQPMKTPTVPKTTTGRVNISYQKQRRQIAKAAKALGDPSMANYQVGIHTFDYFYENEVE